STHSPQIGAAMADVENVYIEAEFAKDWEAAKAIHGDKTCKADLARTDAQRRADAQAQIYADAAANPNASVSFNFVHHIVCSLDVHLEMARRYQGAAPRPFNLDTFRCETIDGKQLDPTETFMDSLTSPFRRVIMDAKGVVIDVSERRFFTGIARTALQISHDECEWPGCHVPSSRCHGDHTLSKQNGGPTTQVNGSILCQRHNRHKERGYTVWRDPVTGDLHIKTPLGTQIC
ncbi:MAG TPA: HNH endonuclease, partial [Acidimicrobiaceae bacterium]|nr:HNH endonuclease [Acidimicrobiaceae bacterium]